MGKKGANPLDRFMAKICKTETCWIWLAGKDWDGYGSFWDGRKGQRAHRWIYERTIGPIPMGLVIDHLCRNPSCVNPAHMRIVSNGENVLAGRSFSAVNKLKTHCKRGHPLTPENLVGKSYPRRCKICHTTQYRQWRADNLARYRELDRNSARKRRIKLKQTSSHVLIRSQSSETN